MKPTLLLTICALALAPLPALAAGAGASPTHSGAHPAADSAAAPAAKARAPSRAVSFKQDMGRVFRDNCTMCHQGEAPMGALDLTPDNPYASLVGGQAAGADKPRVAPGQPDRSYIYYKTSGKNAAVKGNGFGMPWASSLSADDLELLRRWIKDGAPNN
jgi:hypothetical protein